MKFWTEVDGLLLRQAAKHADAVRAGIVKSIDVNDIVERWSHAHPNGGEVSPRDARAWARTNIPVNGDGIATALRDLYATGWVMGVDVSTSAYAHAKLGIQKAAPTADQINTAYRFDWNTWKPGNKPAALLTRPSGKFSQLLESRNVAIKSMNDTTLDRVGTLLADSLEAGSGYTTLSKQLLTDEITSRVIEDPQRAQTIAITEMSRALNVSTVNNYNDMGVEKVEWLSLDACDICNENSDQGPVPLDTEFASGDTEPPAHPNCRCTLIPVIDENPEMTDEEFAQALMEGESESVTEASIPNETAIFEQMDIAPTKDTFPDEYESLKDYTSGSGAYSLVNDYLRGAYEASASELSQIDKITTDLNTLIQNSPSLTAPKTVHRGISSFNETAIDKFLSLKTGDTFIDPAFVSTSASLAVAKGFTKGEGLVMQIELPQGTKSLNVEDYLRLTKPGEQEQMLAPNTKFVVTSPARKIDSQWVIGLKATNG